MDGGECVVCFEALDKSPFSCGHMIHLECQIRSGDFRCAYCRQPFRVTRGLSRLLTQARMLLCPQLWNHLRQTRNTHLE